MSKTTTTYSTQAHGPTLPRRPRLLPGLEVLERNPHEIQIGLDPRHAVVAEGLPREVISVLRRLDGSANIRSLLANADAEHAELLRSVLQGLTERGLVDDAESTVPRGRTRPSGDLWSLRGARPGHDAFRQRAQRTMVVHGSGRLTVALSALLAAAGIGHLDVQTTGRVNEHDLGCGYDEPDLGRPRRPATIRTIQRVNSSTHTTRLTTEHAADLVLLTDTVVPAPEIVRQLVHDRVPHMPVRVRDGIGIVGPLVLPGRSSCLHCADLHRTALDPCWPRVANQLAGRQAHADLTSVHGTASLATGQVLRICTPEKAPPPTWNATLEIDSYAGTVRRRAWQPHPACDCGAKAGNGW